MKTIWTPNEIEILKKYYENTKQCDLLCILKNKTKDQLRWKAKEFKLKKQVGQSNNNMKFLLNFDDKEICYWWGLLMSDGCINKNSIILALHERDEEQVKKFCIKSNSKISKSTRINSWHNEPYTMVRTSIEDKWILPVIKDKLKLVSKKTYNPPDLSIFYTPEKLLPFLIGFIDGDGYVNNKNLCIRIKVHKNWINVFNQIKKHCKEFYNINANVMLNKWVILAFDKKADYYLIKQYVLDSNLPYLDRKWSIRKNS